MNSNGTRPASVYELHRHAQRYAERDGRPRWVVTMWNELMIIEPHEFVPYNGLNANRHYIECVAYPSYWRYRRD